MNQRRFELYAAKPNKDEPQHLHELWPLNRRTGDEASQRPDLVIPEDRSVLWARWSESQQRLEPTNSRHDAELGFYVLRSQFANRLAVITIKQPILVNGLPALSLAVAATQDTLTVGKVTFYVTERIRPHVGQPTEEMVGLKCPMCRIAVDVDSIIVACRCGAVYHHETEDSRPELQADERLNCLDQIRVCLACGRPVVTEEFLVWDPQTL
ncbi:MAG: hypothetical protein GXP27_17575 [Planctomycetes bacterium]|nr:hypothetical protein [Planctomycetota bacterium]